MGVTRPVVLALLCALTSAACSPDGSSPTTSSLASTTSSVAATVDGPVATAAAVTTTTEVGVPVPTFVDENGFDDHTVPSVDSIEQVMALSRSGVGDQAALKFTLPQFGLPADAPGLARAHLMDGNFYALHDEWYYYRLLNGQQVPATDAVPVAGQQFQTVDQIHQWASALPAADLPLGLQFLDDRLYSSAFYDAALHGDPRAFGVGSIVRFPDPGTGRPDHWLIELEYSDVVSPALVAQFFARLQPILPAEVGSQLEWVVRSPQHEQVAQQMAAEQLPFHDRIIHFSDLVPAGAVSVYSEGVTAGRLLYVGEGGAELSDATAGDIVITEHVPDWLPQASALITSDPQTPLAHVNLLARNRGIPNASQAGVHDDAGLRQAARVHAHAIVVARGGTLQVALISREQYATWNARRQQPPVSVPLVDISTMPLVVDLADLVAQLETDGMTEADVARWRPLIGGKSVGFLTLLSTTGLTPPPDPLAITVRPYLEHIVPILDTIAAAISDPDVVDSPRARYLSLEGAGEDYADLFPSDNDAAFAQSFVTAHPPGSALGEVLDAGGVRGLIESRPVAPQTLAAITAVLEQTYGDYDTQAGLRFRSSSSVEDIEGFNGAGLYTSYTGYLRADQLDDPDDRDNTIERALLRAWSSYWSFEAFEERRLAQIDHLSGAMGLTVHARFDDDLEMNNGVATFTFTPGSAPDDAVLEINVQQGSVEVTNPDPQDAQLPEIVRVTRRNGDLTIERIAGSTLVADDQQVMDDAAIEDLFRQTAAVAVVWRSRLNSSLPVAQQVQTVVLDYEFKTMHAGWPQLADGSDTYPARLVLRQVRSLDPGLRGLPSAVRDLPVPRDVLMRAELVGTVSCTVGDAAPVSHIEVLTDPLLLPDMGHSQQPLIVGGEPSAGAMCDRQVLYASSRQALIELVDSGAAFLVLGG
jgi:hypothetical protein